MLRRVQQLLMLVLPMQLDQPIREVLERCGGGEGAVDEGAAAFALLAGVGYWFR